MTRREERERPNAVSDSSNRAFLILLFASIQSVLTTSTRLAHQACVTIQLKVSQTTWRSKF